MALQDIGNFQQSWPLLTAPEGVDKEAARSWAPVCVAGQERQGRHLLAGLWFPRRGGRGSPAPADPMELDGQCRMGLGRRERAGVGG